MRSSFKRPRAHESHVSGLAFCIIKVSGLDFPKSFKSRSRIFKQRSRRLGKSQILPFATPSSDNEAVFGSSRKLGGAVEHLIDGSEKRICRLSFEF